MESEGLIWPIVETTKALREHHEVEGYKSQEEAEEAGLQWGRRSLSIYTPKINFVSFNLTRAQRPGARESTRGVQY